MPSVGTVEAFGQKKAIENIEMGSPDSANPNEVDINLSLEWQVSAAREVTDIEAQGAIIKADGPLEVAPGLLWFPIGQRC